MSESEYEEPFQDSGSEYEPTLSSSEGSTDRELQFRPKRSSPEPQFRSSYSAQEPQAGPSGLQIQPSTTAYEENENDQHKNNSRKRIRNEANWKRNVRKIKRARSESYLNAKGIIVPEKVHKLVQCACPKKCHSLFDENKLESIFRNFYNLSDHNLQSLYLSELIAINEKKRTYKTSDGDSRRNKTRIYKLPGKNNVEQVVCKKFFKQILQVSDGRITRALRHKSNESSSTAPKLDQRGRHEAHNKTSHETIELIKSFIEKFPKYNSHYSRNKNINRQYLAPELNISLLYNLYIQSTSNPASKYVFTKIFTENFNLHFRSPISDSCKKCDALKIKIEAEENSVKRKELESEKELHLRKAESARKGMAQDSKANKDEVAVIAFDLMKTLPTPLISTGVAYYKRQLWTYCLGIHDLLTGSSYMYTWHEGMASRGPQEIGSCIMHYVKNFVKCEKLIMYSDQCGGQNRNIRMSVICNYIVNCPSFAVGLIDHKFLVSGHSFLPCD